MPFDPDHAVLLTTGIVTATLGLIALAVYATKAVRWCYRFAKRFETWMTHMDYETSANGGLSMRDKIHATHQVLTDYISTSAADRRNLNRRLDRVETRLGMSLDAMTNVQQTVDDIADTTEGDHQ